MIALPLAMVLAAVSPQSGQGPTLTSIEPEHVASAFHVRTQAHDKPKIEVVNAYEIRLPDHRRIVDLHSGGFLPVEITLDDGTCFLIEAEYVGGGFRNGKISQRACFGGWPNDRANVSLPPRPGLSLAGKAWGYIAWRDDKTGVTTLVDTNSKGHPVIFDAGMEVVGMGAMRGPDSPGGEISLVGLLNGKPALVTVLYHP